MSVMAETSQLAIGPYVAIAAVGLESYAWTAVCREALVVKVPGGDDGGDGGGAACAQISHPVLIVLPSEDHVKALPSNTLLGPVAPLYVAPFTISLS